MVEELIGGAALPDLVGGARLGSDGGVGVGGCRAGGGLGAGDFDVLTVCGVSAEDVETDPLGRVVAGGMRHAGTACTGVAGSCNACVGFYTTVALLLQATTAVSDGIRPTVHCLPFNPLNPEGPGLPP